MQPKKVLLGLSGGVDSAVAAWLLKKSGYEVVGLYLDTGQKNPADFRKLAEALEIKVYKENVRGAFGKEIVSYFIDEYRRGNTPNPCWRCNRKIKFKFLMQAAKKHRCRFVATGHYARCVYSRSWGGFFIKEHKSAYDQSYFLSSLKKEWLKYLKFPLEKIDKKQAEALAEREGFFSFLRPRSSQDICFVRKDYRKFLQEKAKKFIQPGNIVYRDGKVLGRHPSHLFFTVGQRQNLGISWPEPLYVLQKKAKKNEIVVGEKKFLGQKTLKLKSLNLFVENLPHQARVRIRYRSAAALAQLKKEEKFLMVDFSHPQLGVSPGQAGVVYRFGLVLAGGIIN